MKVQENEPLCRYTTLRTGGPARFLIEARTEKEIQEAVCFAAERQLPLLVLGSGSNVLVNDAGFNGVVVKIASRGIQPGAGQDKTEVVVEAGEEWDALVAWSVERGLYGLENMSLIPGTVGAAMVGNIGAYGAEVKDVHRWTEALDRRTGKVRRFSHAESGLVYRNSFFKTPEGRNFIVIRTAFALARTGVLNTSYKDVQEYFARRGTTAPTLAELREAVITIRRSKLPDLSRVGTAGSFFKNPIISEPDYAALAARYPGLPGHEEGDGRVKVPLGWILDRVCGLRGFRLGRVGTHSQQALVIINDGGTAAEVEALAEEAGRRVRELTGIEVEWEVEKVPSVQIARQEEP